MVLGSTGGALIAAVGEIAGADLAAIATSCSVVTEQQVKMVLLPCTAH